MPKETAENTGIQTKVFLLGGAHVLRIDHKKIDRIHFDAIIREGVDDSDLLEIKNIIKEPVFVLFSFLWFGLLEFIGKDKNSLTQISKERKIQIYKADSKFGEIIDYVHKSYNYLFLAIFFCLFYYLRKDILIAILGMCLLYIPILLYKADGLRNKAMATGILDIIKIYEYKNVLFYSGSDHTKEVAKILKTSGIEVQEL